MSHGPLKCDDGAKVDVVIRVRDCFSRSMSIKDEPRVALSGTEIGQAGSLCCEGDGVSLSV